MNEYGVGLLVSLAVAYFVLSVIVKRAPAEEKQNGLSPEIEEAISDQRKILNVKKFLNASQFYEELAMWQDKIIYKFIFNNGFLYEFSEVLPDDENLHEIDDNGLAFDRLKYKRVANPEEFIKKFKLN